MEFETCFLAHHVRFSQQKTLDENILRTISITNLFTTYDYSIAVPKIKFRYLYIQKQA